MPRRRRDLDCICVALIHADDDVDKRGEFYTAATTDYTVPSLPPLRRRFHSADRPTAHRRTSTLAAIHRRYNYTIQLRFDGRSRVFDCLSKVIKVTLTVSAGPSDFLGSTP